MAIGSDAFHLVVSEGELHSLLIKEMRPSSVGSYCVTAVNPAGTAFCSATVHIQPGESPIGQHKADSNDSRMCTNIPEFMNPYSTSHSLTYTHTHTHRPTGAQ